MDYVVLLKQVPDLAEELEIDADGTGLDAEGQAGDRAAVTLVPEQEGLLERVLVPLAGDHAQPLARQLSATGIDLELFGQVWHRFQQYD